MGGFDGVCRWPGSLTIEPSVTSKEVASKFAGVAWLSNSGYDMGACEFRGVASEERTGQ